MTKPEVRQIARRMGLPVADKSESQEICFIPENDYRKFLKEKRRVYSRVF
ncbi:tRNA methyl transferase-like protein [Leptospira interrogans serovar Grippotyphosa str. LT2186]|uniref:tRNA methyl transferase-like protein n=1 Tax=Leptospira interrogans serovar Grippotyphosa str. LT2186 TaxID=1001599 RepID=M3G053_LEPIR|nr:tRNA methyl transferase-like protein [Leptospira interrogans serovar Grippotyphosa str. LT2186]